MKMHVNELLFDWIINLVFKKSFALFFFLFLIFLKFLYNNYNYFVPKHVELNSYSLVEVSDWNLI